MLRKSELQRRIDSSDTSGDDKAQARQDLDKANSQNPSAGSGASTAGLSALQKRYADDYAKQTATDADALSSAILKVNDDIVAAWKRDLTGDTKEALLASLQTLVASASDEQKAAQQTLATGEAAKADVQPAASADAVVDALRTMKRLRDRLTSTVRSRTELADTQRATATASTAKRTNDEADLASANTNLASAQASLKALQDATASDTSIAAATTKVGESQTVITNLKTKIDADKASEASAIAALKEATDNLARAATSTSSVLDELVLSALERRLSAVKKVETAYGFIGEAATSK